MLKLIDRSIRKELEIFNRLYERALRTPINDFRILLNFVTNGKGKQIRPILLILAAKLCKEQVSYETFMYAVIVELLHVSTLLHDDVVDNSILRRGKQSAMAKFGNKTAVLLGDYILSKAISLSVETKNLCFLEIMSQLSRNLSEGELIQLVSSSTIIQEEDRYFEIIKKKTAFFFSSCLEFGALSVCADLEKKKILRIIGEYIGICFQIKDDILDYSKQEEIGKPTNHDIFEGKITLPLIHALKNASEEQHKFITEVIKNKDFSTKNIKELYSFIRAKHGIIYAQKKIEDIKKKILSLLDYFPCSETKESMIIVIDYIIKRTS